MVAESNDEKLMSDFIAPGLEDFLNGSLFVVQRSVSTDTSGVLKPPPKRPKRTKKKVATDPDHERKRRLDTTAPERLPSGIVLSPEKGFCALCAKEQASVPYPWCLTCSGFYY